MKKKLKIGIDLDGTLADYRKAVVNFLNEKYSKNYTLSDVKRDDCYDVLGKTMLSRAVKLKKFYKYTKSLSKIEPIGSSIPIIRRFHKNNYELYIVTSRFIGFSKASKEWIDKHFGKHLFKKIIFSKILASYATKLKIKKYKRMKVDLVIDDPPYVAEKCAKLGIPVILLDYSWNKNIKIPGVIKAKNWKEIDNIVNKMSNN